MPQWLQEAESGSSPVSALRRPCAGQLIQRQRSAPPPHPEYVGVDHVRRHMGVAQEFLHRADVPP